MACTKSYSNNKLYQKQQNISKTIEISTNLKKEKHNFGL